MPTEEIDLTARLNAQDVVLRELTGLIGKVVATQEALTKEIAKLQKIAHEPISAMDLIKACVDFERRRAQSLPARNTG